MSEEVQTEIIFYENEPSLQKGEVTYQAWTIQEAKKRALKKTLKIVGSIFAVSLIGLFVHILLLVIVPALIITLLAAVPLYLKWSNENATFSSAQGYCPQCKAEKKFRPYVGAQLSQSITLQCPECGQTLKAEIPSFLKTKTN